MLEQHRELRVAEPIAIAFAALAASVSIGRWHSALDEGRGSSMPREGCRYCFRMGRALRRGQVLECLRPVSLVLHETHTQSASRLRLRLKWRIEPIPDGTLIFGDIQAVLNGAALLQRRKWERLLDDESSRVLASVERRLGHLAHAQSATRGPIGQSSGSKAIVKTKMTTVSGKPIFR